MRDRPFIVCNPFNMVTEIVAAPGFTESYFDHCTPSNSFNRIVNSHCPLAPRCHRAIVVQNN